MMAHGTSSTGKMIRRMCTCTKEDFFPGQSFQNWRNYFNALKKIPARLIDRVMARSQDEIELDVKARSQYEMVKTLTAWDLIWFSVGAVVGAGIFVLTGLEAKEHAGPAVVVSYLIAGLSSLLSVMCYTEFAVEIPVAGGSFAYLRVELGDFMAFIAAGNILLEYVIGSAAVARSWTSYFATLCDYDPDEFRVTATSIENDNFNRLDPISVVVIAVICVLAVTSTKISSRFNLVASVIHMLVIVFIIIAGLTKADINNYEPFAPYGLHGIFHASAILFFAFVGFDAVSTMAEETKNPSKDIPFGLIGSIIIATLLYCLLAVTLCLMQPYSLIDPDAPFSIAFVRVRIGWAKYIVDIGALKGMTTVLLVNAIGQARYLTHIARTHLFPPWFAQVSHTFGTPANATIVMLVTTAVISLFTDLKVLSNLLSISTLVIFSFVAIALMVRRYYNIGVTTCCDQVKLIFCMVLIICSAAATSIYWSISGSSWIGYVVTGSIWFASTLLLKIFVPQAKEPKGWGVPMVPWVPSASIFINIFLLGSIDKDTFVRFGIWTGILMVYYLLIGLHSSYDVAKAMEVQIIHSVKALSRIEEGDY